MEIFIAQLVNGIVLGSTYALIAIGLNLMLVVAGVFQYAYPHLVILSMYVYYYSLKFTNGSIILSVLITIIASVLFSVATEPLFRSSVKKQMSLATFMIALGISMIISDLQSKRIHSGAQINFPSATVGDRPLIKADLIQVSLGQLLTIVGTIVAVVIFFLILNKTRQGRAFRAIAQDPFSTKLLGIPILKTTILSYTISGILGGITAVFLAMSLQSVGPGAGDRLGMKIFAIALFAGLGNLWGGVIAALIIGLVESTSLMLIPGRWVEALVYGIIILTVIIKPKGLFGAKV